MLVSESVLETDILKLRWSCSDPAQKLEFEFNSSSGSDF